MEHLEGNFTPVLYMGRKVPKVWEEYLELQRIEMVQYMQS